MGAGGVGVFGVGVFDCVGVFEVGFLVFSVGTTKSSFEAIVAQMTSIGIDPTRNYPRLLCILYETGLLVWIKSEKQIFHLPLKTNEKAKRRRQLEFTETLRYNVFSTPRKLSKFILTEFEWYPLGVSNKNYYNIARLRYLAKVSRQILSNSKREYQ